MKFNERFPMAKFFPKQITWYDIVELGYGGFWTHGKVAEEWNAGPFKYRMPIERGWLDEWIKNEMLDTVKDMTNDQRSGG